MNEKEFWDILAAMPEPKPIFYRLYYNEQGQPLFYTMEDLPGTYIEVDHATYQLNSFSVRVVNGKIKKISTTVTERLVPSEQGTPCHPDNVAIVVSPDQPNQRWSKHTNVYEDC